MNLIKLNKYKSDNFYYPLKKVCNNFKKKLFVYLFGVEKTILFCKKFS